MSYSPELATVSKCTSHLETALKHLDRKLIHFLRDEGFFSDDDHDEILNPQSMLTEADKAVKLVKWIKNRVKQDPGSFHILLEYFEQRGALYKPTVDKLKYHTTAQPSHHIDQSKCVVKKREREVEESFHLALDGAAISPSLCGLLMVLMPALICIILIFGSAVPKGDIELYPSAYGVHLQKLYAKHKVNSGGKWPSVHLVKKYINLAIVSHTPRDTDDIINYVLHGKVEEMLEGKKSIDLDDILKPTNNDDRVSLVLVEGAPGIGKSTLAWEMCRKWNDSEHLKQFNLVVLHRFRDKETQQIDEVRDLFPHYNKHLQQSVADEVSDREGKGVLFILDGFDEFPHNHKGDNFLIKLITRVVLPEATVIGTSRPSAAAEFFSHKPPIDKRVEILGFTQEQVKEYAFNAFLESKSDLENFLKYIKASENPAINSLMYIPLNTVVVVDIYKNNTKTGLPIPRTLTQLYKQLSLTMLYRYLEPKYPGRKIVLNSITDLSKYGSHLSHFQNLSQLAFEKFINEQVIFYNLPDDLIHFDLLDDEKDLHVGGGSISYNFLHLTLQEFLAAYHISHTTHDTCLFKKYGDDKRWSLIWRFVAGFTKLQYFENNTFSEVFVHTKKDRVKIQNFFFLCLFEAELKDQFDFHSIARYARDSSFQIDWKINNPLHITLTSTSDISLTELSISPFEKYVLGYCIVNSAPTVTWNVYLGSESLEMFMWGLNSAKRFKKGVIHTLELIVTNFIIQEARIQEGIAVLKIKSSEMESLVHAVSSMKNLKSLVLSYEVLTALKVICFDYKTPIEHAQLVLQQFLYDNISLTNLIMTGFGSKPPFLQPSENLFMDHSEIYLVLLNPYDVCDAKQLFELAFRSSLQTLTTWVYGCENEELFTSLTNNSFMKNLTIVMLDIPSVVSLAIALQHNTALQYLTLAVTERELVENCDGLKLVLDALKFNKNMKELKINIACSKYTCCYKDFPESRADIDSRIVIGFSYDLLLLNEWALFNFPYAAHAWV